MTTKKKDKKYELLKNDKIQVDGRTLYRIKAIRDIVDSDGNIIVNKGDLGGFVQGERNLSHYGTCWIYGDAMSYSGAMVLDDAILSDMAKIYGRAMVFTDGKICDEAEVSGLVRVFDGAEICDKAHVSGYHHICRIRVDYNME